MTEPDADGIGTDRALRTEQANLLSTGLDGMTAAQVVALMHAADDDVVTALAAAAPALAAAAELMANALRSAHRVILLGAGTGGRIAIQEVAELAPTFGLDQHQVIALVASGAPVGPAAITSSEDDVDAAPASLRDRGTGVDDVVIGIAASGRTPFVLAGLRSAHTLGAHTVGIANNAGTPILTDVELPILLDTGPEVLAGSTRLKAGTAQKIALNRISTAAMVRLGRVTGNRMTHMRVSNDKLRRRAVGIVVDLLGVSADAALELLKRHSWDIPAALVAGEAPTDAGRRAP